jgi:hypothetical protein
MERSVRTLNTFKLSELACASGKSCVCANRRRTGHLYVFMYVSTGNIQQVKVLRSSKSWGMGVMITSPIKQVP